MSARQKAEPWRASEHLIEEIIRVRVAQELRGVYVCQIGRGTPHYWRETCEVNGLGRFYFRQVPAKVASPLARPRRCRWHGGC